MSGGAELCCAWTRRWAWNYICQSQQNIWRLPAPGLKNTPLDSYKQGPEVGGCATEHGGDREHWGHRADRADWADRADGLTGLTGTETRLFKKWNFYKSLKKKRKWGSSLTHRGIPVAHLKSPIFGLSEHLTEKNVFFREFPKLPLPPIRASWTIFFGRQKRRLNAYYRNN